MTELTRENLYEEFIQDTTIDRGDIAEFGYSLNQLLAKWLKIKNLIQDKLDVVEETETAVRYKLRQEYLTRKRTNPNIGMVVNSNVDDCVKLDPLYKEVGDKIRCYSQLMENVDQYYLPYFQGVNYTLTNINKYLGN